MSCESRKFVRAFVSDCCCCCEWCESNYFLPGLVGQIPMDESYSSLPKDVTRKIIQIDDARWTRGTTIVEELSVPAFYSIVGNNSVSSQSELFTNAYSVEFFGVMCGFK